MPKLLANSETSGVVGHVGTMFAQRNQCMEVLHVLYFKCCIHLVKSSSLPNCANFVFPNETSALVLVPLYLFPLDYKFYLNLTEEPKL